MSEPTPQAIQQAAIPLDSPIVVQQKLQTVALQLGLLRNGAEDAARAFYGAKGQREVAAAEAFAAGGSTVGERQQAAKLAAGTIGLEAEAVWEARKMVLRVLETEANILMAILKSHTRGAGEYIGLDRTRSRSDYDDDAGRRPRIFTQ